MFELFTESARRVIFFARFEAAQWGSPFIETEHLLIGVLGQDHALALESFEFEEAIAALREQISSPRAAARAGNNARCRPKGSRKRSSIRMKLSWHEKMSRPAKVVDIPPKMQKRLEPGKMLIPSPLDVDALIRTIKRGTLVTQSQIRERLARAHQADAACPIVTGMFVRIAAEAAEEDLRSGKHRVTPYWRVLRDDGTLNEKLKKQAARLREEGHVIEPGPRKGSLRVRGFSIYLTWP